MSKDKQGSKARRTYENGDEMLSGEIRSLRALAKRVAACGDAPQIKLEDLLKIVEFHGRAPGVLRYGRSHPGGGGDGMKNVEKKAGAFVLQESAEEKDLQEIHTREKADMEALVDGSAGLKDALQILLQCLTRITALEKEIQKS